MHTGTHTHRQSGRQTDRQTHTHIDKQTHRHTCTEAYMHTGTHAHLHTYTQTHRGTGDRAEAHQPAWQKATLPIKLSILKLDRSGRRMDGGVAEPVAGCDGEPGTRKHWDQEWRRCRCQVCKHNEEIFGMTGREIKRALVAKEAKEEKERRAAAEKAAKVEAERAAAEKVAAVAEARAAAAAAAATAVPLFGGGVQFDVVWLDNASGVWWLSTATTNTIRLDGASGAIGSTSTVETAAGIR